MIRNPNEDQVLRSLDNAIYTLGRTINSSGAVSDVVKLPEAFAVVIKRLPLLAKVLESIDAYFKHQKKTDEMEDEYTAVYQLAEVCRARAEYLQDLFDTVKATDNPIPNIERYRMAVADNDGARIETVFEGLLEQAINVAAVPLVDDDLANELRDALEEVAALEPSLKDQGNKGTTTLYNYGAGNQFYHGGAGNQNHCAGGVQITGNNSTNHMSPSNNSTNHMPPSNDSTNQLFPRNKQL